MIGKLSGVIDMIQPQRLILNVSGVGYLVSCSKEVLSAHKVGDTLSLFTYLAVRENSLDLYGFFELNELHFFELLLSVPGIGPRSALAVLNVAPVDMMADAIAAGDSSYLTKVSGIGKKSAEKIVLELRDKVGSLARTEMSQTDNNNSLRSARRDDIDTLEALKMLGYSQNQARDALNEVSESVEGVQDRIRAALKILAK